MKATRFAVAAGCIALTAIAGSQIAQLIKLVGVAAAVKQFGPQINRGINGLTKHTDTALATTKVVPIFTVGLKSRNAVGAAQVTGPKEKVAKVLAVGQIDQGMFGNEIKIRAMFPINSTDITHYQVVQGVGISGLVDLKL